MVTILLLLKFSDKLCGARMTASDGIGFVEDGYHGDHQMGDLGMDDGAGTMMDFNLQETGSVRSQRTAQSQVGYSPGSEAAPASNYGREFAL